MGRLRAVSLFSSLSHVRERASSGEAARREKRWRQPEKNKESLSFFVPFPSLAFSHARVHSRAFSTDQEKRETARSLANGCHSYFVESNNDAR